MGSTQEYDLVVIGSGPGGQKAAIAAAKLGKSVAVIERGRMLGGVCVNTGTIPSKTLREAVVYLTGMSQRELYGASYRVKEKITPADLLARTQHVIGKEIDVVRSQLMRNRVELYVGHARFVDDHSVTVEDPVRAERITVRGQPHRHRHRHQAACGPPASSSTRHRVLDSDGILDLKTIPASMVVVGAGVIGIEYASMFAALGTKVTVVEKRDTMLDFCDPGNRRGPALPPARPRRHLPLRRRGHRRRRRLVGHRHHAGQRQADPRRHRHVLGGTAGPDRPPRPPRRRPRGRQPRPDLRRRQLPDQGRSHLRRRRRDRLPRAGRDVDGSGPPRRLSRLRRTV